MYNNLLGRSPFLERFFLSEWTKLLYFYLTLYTQALQEHEELFSRPAHDSRPTLGKDVSGNVDIDAMEEYCITDLPGGEVPPPALSEKGIQTERLNAVEKEIQTEQSKLVNVATQKIFQNLIIGVQVCKNSPL